MPGRLDRWIANGAEIFSWPDGGMHPFRGKKGHDVGRWLPVPRGGALARVDQAWHHPERHHVARRLAALRQDPFERTPFESDFYRRFQADKLWTLVLAQAFVGAFIQSFKEYPPSQRSGAMNLDVIMEQLRTGARAVT